MRHIMLIPFCALIPRRVMLRALRSDAAGCPCQHWCTLGIRARAAIAVIATLVPWGVRFRMSMRILPSFCRVRRQVDKGVLSPTRVSVTTTASRSTYAARRTAAPPSPSCATTPRPPSGSLRRERPRRSLVTMVSEDRSATSSCFCPATRKAARSGPFMPSPAMNWSTPSFS